EGIDDVILAWGGELHRAEHARLFERGFHVQPDARFAAQLRTDAGHLLLRLDPDKRIAGRIDAALAGNDADGGIVQIVFGKLYALGAGELAEVFKVGAVVE